MSGSPGPNASGTMFLPAADVDRGVAHAREALDLLDHLGVVVGDDERLAPAVTLDHRQEPDEVGEPGERRGLQLRVLVQVVVDLPRLVADPEVVGPGLDHVEEDVEVREQDLVHLADRLEHVQLVPRPHQRLDVRRLARQEAARQVDALAVLLEHARHRVLGEPVDLEARHEVPQLPGDRHVALRVPEPDGARDEQRPPRPARVRPTPRRAAARAGPRAPRDELGDHQVAPHRVAHHGHVAAALEHYDLGRGEEPRELVGVGERRHGVLAAVDDEDWLPHARPQLARPRRPALDDRGDQRLGRDPLAPRDDVVLPLRRAGLGEDAAGEPAPEVGQVLAPVVGVVLAPPLAVGRRLEERRRHARSQRGTYRQRRRCQGQGLDALRPLDRDQRRPPRAGREGEQHGAVDARVVHHGQGVAGEVAHRVPARRPVGAAVPPAVERHDPQPEPGQERHLHLPHAAVDQGPGRQADDRARRVHGPEDIVADAHAVGRVRRQARDARLEGPHGRASLRPHGRRAARERGALTAGSSRRSVRARRPPSPAPRASRRTRRASRRTAPRPRRRPSGAAAPCRTRKR